MTTANITAASSPSTFASRNVRPAGWMPSERLELLRWADFEDLHSWVQEVFPDSKGVVDDPLPEGVDPRKLLDLSDGAREQGWSLVLRVSRNMGIPSEAAEAVLRAQSRAHRAHRGRSGPGPEQVVETKLWAFAQKHNLDIGPEDFEKLDVSKKAIVGGIGVSSMLNAAVLAMMGLTGAEARLFADLGKPGSIEDMPPLVREFLGAVEKLHIFDLEMWSEPNDAMMRAGLIAAGIAAVLVEALRDRLPDRREIPF